MVTVSIGGAEYPLEQISERWVNQVVAESRRLGQPLCVRVDIRLSGVQIVLATPGCGGGLAAGRPPNERERRIIEAWTRRGLHTGQFAPGELQSFLRELARLT